MREFHANRVSFTHWQAGMKGLHGEMTRGTIDA